MSDTIGVIVTVVIVAVCVGFLGASTRFKDRRPFSWFAKLPWWALRATLLLFWAWLAYRGYAERSWLSFGLAIWVASGYLSEILSGATERRLQKRIDEQEAVIEKQQESLEEQRAAMAEVIEAMRPLYQRLTTEQERV